MIDINPNKQNQQTIRETISISGIGLHSGKQVEMKLVPAEVAQWFSHKMNNRHSLQLKKSKKHREPYWSYQLNSTASLAILVQF